MLTIFLKEKLYICIKKLLKNLTMRGITKFAKEFPTLIKSSFIKFNHRPP